MNKLCTPLKGLKWVERDALIPNDYNPNVVSRQNLELLTTSIFVNGFTLPIVCRPDNTIIDGFHRYTVFGSEWKYVTILRGKLFLKELEARCQLSRFRSLMRACMSMAQ